MDYGAQYVPDGIPKLLATSSAHQERHTLFHLRQYSVLQSPGRVVRVGSDSVSLCEEVSLHSPQPCSHRQNRPCDLQYMGGMYYDLCCCGYHIRRIL